MAQQMKRALVLLVLIGLGLAACLAWWQFSVAPGSETKLGALPAATESKVAPTAAAEPGPVAPVAERIGSAGRVEAAAELLPDASSQAAASHNATADADDPETAVRAFLTANAKKARESVEVFCSENQRLAGERIFNEPKRAPDATSHDAAAFMAPRIDWERGARANGLLHLSEPLHQRLEGAKNDWLTALSPADAVGLDFSWLRALLAFDVWTVAAFGPLRDDADDSIFDAPIPNYITLLEWVKLRFVHALAVGDGASAHAEVAHLAELVPSNGLVLAEAIAIAMLKLDVQARVRAVALGQDVSAWPALDIDALQRSRRVALAGPYFFAPGVEADVMRRARGCAISPCSALAEGLALHVALAAYAPNTRPSVEAVLGDAPCARVLLERVRRGAALAPPAAAQRLGPDRIDELVQGR